MAEEPEPTILEWCDFLRDRIAEDRRAAEGAAFAPDGLHAHPWELTEAALSSRSYGEVTSSSL